MLYFRSYFLYNLFWRSQVNLYVVFIFQDLRKIMKKRTAKDA
ncbi:hypothetical protein GXM_08041 [Nostoc sphaeroides CCNUC1]|uniref:Uncharacterized protein n=1 Tax=Nostoc sphaeroides CCNUC1 TaxID=2653204 RepID=A0A5P8WCK2_9NOSO|nr:hypothetical protein GXM_08041 [Nostoc sphaeroides CCNUC1]